MEQLATVGQRSGSGMFMLQAEAVLVFPSQRRRIGGSLEAMMGRQVGVGVGVQGGESVGGDCERACYGGFDRGQETGMSRAG